MRQIFRDTADKKILRHHLRNTFRNYARCLIDVIRIPYISSKEIIKLVDFRGIENAAIALGMKRGLILVSLHIGNWDLAGCYLGALKLPLVAVAETTEPKMFDFYTKRREHTGIKTIPLNSSPFSFARVLKENRVLGLIGDRDVTHSGIRTKFFNGWRMVPTGAERLAKAFKSPVSICYVVLNNNKPFRYLGMLEKPEIVKDRWSFTEKIVEKFEHVIREFPDQWFVFRSEWVN